MQARGLGVFVEKALERVQSERRRGSAFWGINATRDGMPLLEGGGEKDEEEEEERERKRRRGENQKKRRHTHTKRQGKAEVTPSSHNSHSFSLSLSSHIVLWWCVVCVLSHSGRLFFFSFLPSLSLDCPRPFPTLVHFVSLIATR